ncbi:hypothetical protein HK097_004320, partial [Rhizophlyctis rosea]
SIIRDKIDVSTLSSKTLKAILARDKVSAAGVLERSELLERVNMLLDNVKAEISGSGGAEPSEEMLCKVSFPG